MTKSTIYLGSTKVEMDIEPKTMKSGKNGFFGSVNIDINGQSFIVQVLSYPKKRK